MHKQELGTGRNWSLTFHVIFFELIPQGVILLPGTRLGRVECVEMKEYGGLQLLFWSDSTRFKLSLLDTRDVFEVEHGYIL